MYIKPYLEDPGVGPIAGTINRDCMPGAGEEPCSSCGGRGHTHLLCQLERLLDQRHVHAELLAEVFPDLGGGRARVSLGVYFTIGRPKLSIGRPI